MVLHVYDIIIFPMACWNIVFVRRNCLVDIVTFISRYIRHHCMIIQNITYIWLTDSFNFCKTLDLLWFGWLVVLYFQHLFAP